MGLEIKTSRIDNDLQKDGYEPVQSIGAIVQTTPGLIGQTGAKPPFSEPPGAREWVDRPKRRLKTYGLSKWSKTHFIVETTEQKVESDANLSQIKSNMEKNAEKDPDDANYKENDEFKKVVKSTWQQDADPKKIAHMGKTNILLRPLGAEIGSISRKLEQTPKYMVKLMKTNQLKHKGQFLMPIKIQKI